MTTHTHTLLLCFLRSGNESHACARRFFPSVCEVWRSVRGGNNQWSIVVVVVVVVVVVISSLEIKHGRVSL